MLRTTILALICACAVKTELYLSVPRPSNRGRKNMDSLDLIYLNNNSMNNNDNANPQNLDTLSSPSTKWINITDQAGNTIELSTINPTNDLVNSEDNNSNKLPSIYQFETTSSRYPNNYQDLSKYLSNGPRYPNYPTESNTLDKGLISPLYTNRPKYPYKPESPNTSIYPSIPDFPDMPIYQNKPQYPNMPIFPIKPEYPPFVNVNINEDISPILPSTPLYPVKPAYPNVPEYPNIPIIPNLPQDIIYPVPTKHPTILQNPDLHYLDIPSQTFPKDQNYPNFPSNVAYPYDPQVDNEDPSLPTPPKYFQSLKDFDQVSRQIRSNLQNPPYNDIDSTKYTIIVSVIDGLIKIMTHGSWQYYVQDFNARVPGFMNFASNSPSQVKHQVRCVHYEAYKNIKELQNLMTNNKWIQLVCRVSVINCDLVIHALVKAGNEELKREARLLIALGKVSSLFLRDYSEKLNQAAGINGHPQNLSMFIMSSREYLKPLIRAGSEARRMFPSSDQCYNQLLNDQL